uniref:Uncharacterized protein n=1 Tax=Fagus sylvatica TaxID=28930 RepID=A0A2N9HF91_FAGSY
MGKFAKLVNTEEKIAQFKSRYGIPEDVHIRYVPYGDLALLQRQDLVLPIVAIVEGGCAPNVFRIVMGTAVLMEKLSLNLTVHDITYVYYLQKTGRDQYTLVARNVDRKLVTGLPNSSKGRDEDFLVFTGNWHNPLINCPLRPGVPDKEFTAKKVEFVERKTVEHLLAKPCFIDSGGRPRAASILLDYVPSYKSFQKGPTVKHFRQEEVPQLVPPLSDPGFVPSLESSERLCLERPPLETSGTSPRASSHAPPPGFSQGEDVMRKKRKRGKEQNDDVSGQEGSSPSRLPKAKASKRGKSKNDRDLQKATGQVSQRLMHQDDSRQPWSCTFLLENRPVDEGDSVLKSGKGVRGGEVAEVVGKASSPSRRHEGLAGEEAVQGIFEAGNRLLETERRLNQSREEIKRLTDFEKSASAKIRAAESAQKSAEAVRVENGQLKDALTEAEAKVQKSEEQAQAYYDQGFSEATDSLMSQLKDECNTYFVLGWTKALDNAEVDDASELYDLAWRHRPFGGFCVKGAEPILAEDPEMPEDQAGDQIQAVEPQEGEDGSDDENIDVID